MKVPCIGTKITGLEESIINGKTGILVEKGNISELTDAMEKLMLDESLRNSLSVEAYNRVRKDFDSRILNKILLEDYKNLQLYLDITNIKTKAFTKQYSNASFRVYSKSSIFTDFGECCEGDCKQCNKFIKEESDKIRKQLDLK